MTDRKSYFNKEKIALRLCGISFRDHEHIVYRILSKLVLFYCCMYPCLALGDLFKHDFEAVADALTYEFPLFVGVIKALTVLINKKKIANVLEKIDSSNFRNTSEGEQLRKRCLLITTVQTCVYWFFSGAAYVFGVTYTLSKRIRSSDYHDWQFPYGKFTILNTTHSPNFEISWFYQCSSCAIVGILFTSTDLLITSLLCHICYRLIMVQHDLRGIVENTYKRIETRHDSSRGIEADDYDNVRDWKRWNASLKGVVEYHLEIIKVTKEVNEAFSMLLLLVFLGMLSMLSLMVYKASLIPLTDIRMLRSCVETFSVFLQIVLICYWSEEMAFEGRQVGNAAYDAWFPGTDLRFQKSLILIMRRSQYPITLTAGFVDVSLSTLTWILRSTYSGYMILRKHNLRDNMRQCGRYTRDYITEP